MLRSKRFTRLEIVILYVLATLMLTAGVGGIFLAVGQAHLRLALASGGILAIAAVYLLAAKRGSPL